MATPGVTFDVRLDGDETLCGLEQLLAVILAPEDAFDAIGATLLSSTHERFQRQESPEGAPWAPLADSTIRRRGSQAAILRDGGDLYRGLDYEVDSGGVTLGSNAIYAAIQQLGGTDDMAPGPAAIPARPFLGLSDEDQDTIAEVFSDFLQRAGDGR